MRLPRLAVVNFLLAGGLLAVGLPSIRADFNRLPVEATVTAVQEGQTVDQAEIDAALPALERAAATSPAARGDFATLLMASAVGARATERLEHSAREFKAYLAEVPGDARAWTMLAEVEQRLEEGHAAQQALKMSILMAPWMPGLVLARCAVGIDLYPFLDQEAHGLLAEEFRIAARRSPHQLALLARQRNAILIARVMLAGNPEAVEKFESALSKL